MMGALILFGTLGFIIVERYHWFDALYMTVITLTTVGYYEVRALSVAGRVFNMVLLLVGVNAILFGVAGECRDKPAGTINTDPAQSFVSS